MNPLHTIIQWWFLSHLDPEKKYIIYSDISHEKRTLTPNIILLSLEELISSAKDSSLQDTSVIICITMKLTHQDILAVDSYDNRPKLWLSLHSGIMSSIYKHSIEEDDITRMLSQGYRVLEPYDESSFSDSLRQPAGYVRIIDAFLPDSIPVSHNKNSADSDFVLINTHDHYHDSVIITTGSSLTTVSQSIRSDGEHTAFTLMVQWWWSDSISDPTIIEHIKHASCVIIVIEHKATEAIWMYYDVLIKQYNPQITLSYVFPQYHLLTSILPDYAYELVGFDSQRISEYIQSES